MIEYFVLAGHNLGLMDGVLSVLTVATVSLLAAVSPGPDFFIVLKNSLSYSRKTGLLTALGISLALLIHLSYTILGAGLFLAEGSFFYGALKYLGACYLFYIGFKSFVFSFKKQLAFNLNYTTSTHDISGGKALFQGFLTNLLNPKCALFFISFFSQFIEEETPLQLKITYGLVNWIISLGWFLFLSYLLTGRAFMTKIERARIHIDRVMGVLLMALGLKMFF